MSHEQGSSSSPSWESDNSSDDATDDTTEEAAVPNDAAENGERDGVGGEKDDRDDNGDVETSADEAEDDDDEDEPGAEFKPMVPGVDVKDDAVDGARKRRTRCER